MNASVERDPLLQLVADLPIASSESARAARVQARCRKVMASRNEQALAQKRTAARDSVLTRAFYRIWYSFGASEPIRVQMDD